MLRVGFGQLLVVHFWADWAPQCKQVADILDELAKDDKYRDCKFLKVEAEALPEISQKFNVVAVPTCILIKGSREIDRVNGANVPELTSKVDKFKSAGSVLPPPKQDLNTRLKALLESAPVLLFMKGTPDEPRCGFSRTIVGLLAERNVEFRHFNILTDEEVRQGLKTYSNWPTYPQLYVKGELIGGLDIVKELIESGEFDSMVPKKQNLDDRLKQLIGQEKVMLFMKGNPETPRCGFSRTMIEILSATGVKYGTFDILQDEDVRQGLKKFSNWPTYPQLYVNSELIGGLDIVKELQESGDLVSALEG